MSACVWMATVILPARLTGHGADLPPGFIEDLVADSLNPTSMCVSDDGKIFLAQKDGRILVIDEQGHMADHPVVIIHTDVTNERGLQGIALHPSYPDSAYLYAFYTVPSIHRNRVSRFSLNGDLAIPGSERIIIELDPMTGTVHNGGALAFNPMDGMLYVSTGEAGKGINSQDTTNLLGKILRLRADGSIPETNPFFSRFEGKNRAIYALGLRNPFSMTIDKTTGQLYVCDVGSGFFEEINIILPGKNYGWPLIEGKRVQQEAPPMYQDPFFVYPHSQGCAIVGAAFYQPDDVLFPDSLRHRFFFGDYCNGTWYHLDPMSPDPVAMIFATGIHRPLAIATSSDGFLYYLAREGQGGGSQEDNKVSTDGTLWKIQYTGNGKPHISVDPQDAFLPVGEDALFSIQALGEDPLVFQWYMNGDTLHGANTQSLLIEEVTLDMNTRTYHCVVTNTHGADTSASAILHVTSNTRPQLYFDFPLTGTLYTAGDTIRFAGHAYDAEDGILSAGQYEWRIDFHHNTHVHPAMEPVQGINYGTYITPKVNETDPSVWYRIHFSVSDSEGLSASRYLDVFPDVMQIHLEGPEGITINADGRLVVLPAVLTSVKGIKHILLAPAAATVAGNTHIWQGFGNGSTDLLFEFFADGADTVITLQYDSFVLGNGTGLLGEYFDDPEADLDGEPNAILIDTIIDFRWGNGPPLFNFPRDFFTVRWTGWVTPYLDGAWTFHVLSDDGCRLWVDDQLILDEWHGQSPTEHSFTLHLEGGHHYAVRLEYLEEDGGAEVELAWSHERFSREVIPKSQLIPARLVGKGNLMGEIWVDSDYDQLRDTTEAALDHVILLLYRHADTSLYAAQEVQDGAFAFLHVREDVYFLQAVYTGADDTLIPSHGVEKNGYSLPFFIQGGFEYQHPIAFSTRRGKIEGKVWEDTDANGFPDDDEAGVEDVICILHLLSSGSFSFIQTDAQGNFLFDEVDPGQVKLELANIPEHTTYVAGTGLQANFTTSTFTHDTGEDHHLLLGLVPLQTETKETPQEQTSLYPNPAGDYIFLDPAQSLSIVKLWNETGVLLLEKQVTVKDAAHKIDLPGYSPGMYMFELIHTDGHRLFKKIARI